MSTDASSSFANELFSHSFYTIMATIPPNTVPVDTNERKGPYPVGTTYEIKLTPIKDSDGSIPLALMYATFQIALSDIASYQAESYMNKIVTNQEIQTAASRAITEAEQMQKDIKDTGESQALPDEFILECYTAGITEINGKQLCTVDEATDVVTPLDVTLSTEELDYLIGELGLARDEASSTSQEDMVFAEEYLGQYTSYLSGSSTNIDELGSALQGIAQRI